MRDTIEILFGDGAAYSARREWVKVGGSHAQGGCDTYGDIRTIKRNGAHNGGRDGDTVKMWHLHDFKLPQAAMGKSYRSAKNWVEYDLAAAQRRTLYFSWHAEAMGAGANVCRVDEPSPWRPVLPGSVAQLLLKIAGMRR
ncbi:MAG: hypothetical protein FJY56_19330 [Betaproteobacteria bacterium]|nr:hypothetical protein [Betaproteobacteria bacterium]